MEGNMQTNIQQLIARLGQIDLFGIGGDPLPTPLSACKKAVAVGAPLLPSAYVASYIQLLEGALPRLFKLASQGDPTTVETLAGAVYQHKSGQQLTIPLNRFLAVISDLYRSFLDKEKRQNAGIPIVEVLPPLAMFQHDGSNGPFTLPVDDVARIIGGSVGVVSMPATYASDAFIWAALAHETGGHDVTHADSGLLDELSNNVATAFTGMAADSSISSDDLVRLWAYWMDEASADVYGLLNVGPAFAPNLAVFFATLNLKGSGTATLRTESGFSPNDPQHLLDPHPTDILRLHLAIGVIDVLVGLSAASKATYIQQIETIASGFSPGPTIRIAGNIPDNRNMLQPLQVEVPLAYARQAARSVGGYIATQKLRTLNGRTIQDIETWDDPDETQAQEIKNALLANQAVARLGDDAQLLAGATLALLEQPAAYDDVTSALNVALDESFRTDPIWGAPPVDAVYIRYTSNQTSPSRDRAPSRPPRRRADRRRRS
jgi:hypothetical protein